jgi:hypothetical protein
MIAGAYPRRSQKTDFYPIRLVASLATNDPTSQEVKVITAKARVLGSMLKIIFFYVKKYTPITASKPAMIF